MESPTTIDQLGLDLLGNILARLSAFDFASANAASSLFHHGCRRVLCRPKLLSACSFNPSLNDAVKEVVNKILSEPMRPHFAIAYIGFAFGFQEAEQVSSMIDNFFKDVREFSSSISGCNSPAAIIMFGAYNTLNLTLFMEKLEYEMSPDIVVGDLGCEFKDSCTGGGINAVVALVFVKEVNKPFGNF